MPKTHRYSTRHHCPSDNRSHGPCSRPRGRYYCTAHQTECMQHMEAFLKKGEAWEGENCPTCDDGTAAVSIRINEHQPPLVASADVRSQGSGSSGGEVTLPRREIRKSTTYLQKMARGDKWRFPLGSPRWQLFWHEDKKTWATYSWRRAAKSQIYLVLSHSCDLLRCIGISRQFKMDALPWHR